VRPNEVGGERLAAVVAAVEDPVFFAPLGVLGTLRSVQRTRRGVEVELAVPAAGHPALAELTARVRVALASRADDDAGTAPAQVGGGSAPSGASVPDVEIATVTLDRAGEEELEARLRQIDERAAGLGEGGGAAVGGRGAAAHGGGGAAGHGGGGAARPSPFSGRGSHTRVIAVASGKGGVGKSSVTVNLAVALARAGHSVGLLDADIYGFWVPRMLGVAAPPVTVGRLIVPPVACGVRVVSMAFFVDEDAAVAWRGPMLHRALEQFLVDVHWGGPEYLLVDMPPGTGDVPLSVAQQLPRAELIVVTTPQPAAQRVAQRAAALARQLRLPVRGVVENMSFFEAPDGSRYELFGSGGGAALAASLGVPLLARIPLVPLVREGADEGRPAALVDPEGPVARSFGELAAKLAEMGPARVYRRELSVT
jgi:ATP-binding protein involved in chromosome partitioning